ncbi:(2Fe-2S)-binding protein [Corticibacter populi]|uniref:(2Fe-2S)-binding protein n=1 Tax=Corticibacter populi TaxID=1550736 RepID=A0A3M6QM28_9BURK|nr:(2Fe-2S)-binding protein [Corticibacter populi]RMX03579.1 (2Fe-2S)-binding protein [Corticibacter populi]RZS30034.1 nicotinate dehydrogenase subunit A [Corticibacter populi]
MPTRIHVNGREAVVDAALDTPLLYVLRNDLQLNGAKYGCGAAQCGACKIILDGRDVPSCVVPLSAAVGLRIETVEGLARNGRLHPVQQAFIDEQAAQCGYCTAGMVIAAKALLDRSPRPDEGDIREAMAAHLCRCGTYHRIIRAVQRAAARMTP